jgi:hypothetical protein
MASPRAAIRFDGVDANQVTYLADGEDIVFDATKVGGSDAVGRAVMVAAAKTVRLTADGARVLGKLTLVEADGTVAVQEEGYADLPGGVAAALTSGAKVVGALGPDDARGYIRAIDPTELADVAAGGGAIVDASDPAHVWVKL